MPPIGVLIKPASGKCNMRCAYCFYHELAENRSTADYGFMSDETLEAVVRRVLEYASGEATFSFQGGEPTLCGLDFYKKAVALQRKYNVNSVKISNCLQTNGLLLDEDWARFLHDSNFLVGLSVDGPSDIHNANRVDAQGKGTFQRLMNTAALLEKHRVEFNILFVVTAMSARHPDKVYGFFKEHGFRFLQFIPCIEPADGESGSRAFSLTPKDFETFLKRLFDKWSSDLLSGNYISIRYFDNLVRMAMGMEPETCTLFGQCLCQLVFEADGSVYPCDFYVNDGWRLGSIHESSAAELLGSDRAKAFVTSSAQALPLCRDCRWFGLCRGGCRRDRESSVPGALGRNRYCEAYSAFLDDAYPKLIAVARHVSQRGV